MRLFYNLIHKLAFWIVMLFRSVCPSVAIRNSDFLVGYVSIVVAAIMVNIRVRLDNSVRLQVLSIALGTAFMLHIMLVDEAFVFFFSCFFILTSIKDF